MRRLINRLAPYPLERLSSLLERLRRANYYEEPHWYQALISQRLTGSVDTLTAPEHYEAFAEITGLSPEELYNLTIHRLLRAYAPAGQADQERRFWQPSWARPYIHGKRTTKLCPLCWKQCEAVLLPWASRHVTTCAVHHVLLLDTCPACNEPLVPSFPRGCCRVCATPLADLPAVPFVDHPDSMMLSMLVWRVMGAVSEVPAPVMGLSKDHPLRSLPPPMVLDFLWNGYHLLILYDQTSPLFDDVVPHGVVWKQPPRDLRSAVTHEVHGALTGMCRLLRGWPDTWDRTLAHLLELPRPVTANRPFLAELVDRFQDPEYIWLHQGWLDYMRGVMHQNPAVVPWLRYYRSMQSGQLPVAPPPLSSQREAARLLGISENQLRGFVEQGLLRTTAVPEQPTARQWQLIDTESVEELRAIRASHLSLEQVATLIGISKEHVVALVGAGVLDALSGPVVDNRSIWRFDAVTVRTTLERLFGGLPVQPRPQHGSGSFTCIEALRILTALHVSLPRLLIDSAQGRLPMFRLAEGFHIGMLWCEETALRQYQHHLRQSVFPLLSVHAVCRRLKCKPATLRRLYGAGILVPVADDTDQQGITHQYTEEDVVAFQEQYIDSGEAATVLGVTRITVQGWVRSGRLVAVTGPEIDGSHAYRFEKAALVQWRQERLTPGEAIRLLGVSKATLHRWTRQGKLTPLEGMGGTQYWYARAAVEALRAGDG
ncbi:MAG: hypothetical protein OHK0022_07120 [Roseiflexaceae bacterium]